MTLLSKKDVVKEFANVPKVFSGKETDQNWEKRVASMQELRKIMKAEGFSAWKTFFVDCLHKVVSSMILTIHSMRSSVALEGLFFIHDLAARLESNLDHYIVEVVISNLIKCCSSTKKIIVTKANEVAEQFIAKTNFNLKVFSVLCKHIKDKNTQIRQSSALFIKIMLETHGAKANDKIASGKTESASLLQQFIIKGLSDASSGVREGCRHLYSIYRQHWPEEAKKLLKNMDPGTLRQLEKPSTKPSSTLSVSLLTRSNSAPLVSYAKTTSKNQSHEPSIATMATKMKDPSTFVVDRQAKSKVQQKPEPEPAMANHVEKNEEVLEITEEEVEAFFGDASADEPTAPNDNQNSLWMCSDDNKYENLMEVQLNQSLLDALGEDSDTESDMEREERSHKDFSIIHEDSISQQDDQSLLDNNSEVIQNDNREQRSPVTLVAQAPDSPMPTSIQTVDDNAQAATISTIDNREQRQKIGRPAIHDISSVERVKRQKSEEQKAPVGRLLMKNPTKNAMSADSMISLGMLEIDTPKLNTNEVSIPILKELQEISIHAPLLDFYNIEKNSDFWVYDRARPFQFLVIELTRLIATEGVEELIKAEALRLMKYLITYQKGLFLRYKRIIMIEEAYALYDIIRALLGEINKANSDAKQVLDDLLKIYDSKVSTQLLRHMSVEYDF